MNRDYIRNARRLDFSAEMHYGKGYQEDDDYDFSLEYATPNPVRLHDGKSMRSCRKFVRSSRERKVHRALKKLLKYKAADKSALAAVRFHNDINAREYAHYEIAVYKELAKMTKIPDWIDASKALNKLVEKGHILAWDFACAMKILKYRDPNPKYYGKFNPMPRGEKKKKPDTSAPAKTPAKPDRNKFCTDCGFELAINSKFCTHCGKPVQLSH